MLSIDADEYFTGALSIRAFCKKRIPEIEEGSIMQHAFRESSSARFEDRAELAVAMCTSI